MNQPDRHAAYLFDRKDDGVNNFEIIKSLKKAKVGNSISLIRLS